MVSRGFTLVEIIIVVLILGIVAGVAAPMVVNRFKEATCVAFAKELIVFVDAAELFHAETGEWPADSSSGKLPASNPFSNYVRVRQWVRPTPIGGDWDFENNDNGVTAAVGVHFWSSSQILTTAEFEHIDEMIDDGSAKTGSLRLFGSDRYYWVLEE